MVRCDLVAIEQRGGVAQRDQGGVAVACQPQWEVQLLPCMPSVSTNTPDLQLLRAFVQAYVFGCDEDQVVAQVLQLQGNLFSEPLYAPHVLSEESSIDHDHLEFLLFNESRWVARGSDPTESGPRLRIFGNALSSMRAAQWSALLGHCQAIAVVHPLSG